MTTAPLSCTCSCSSGDNANHRSVRIYGHYAVIEEPDPKYYRHPIHGFSFTALDGKEKWAAYRPLTHFRRMLILTCRSSLSFSLQSALAEGNSSIVDDRNITPSNLRPRVAKIPLPRNVSQDSSAFDAVKQTRQRFHRLGCVLEAPLVSYKQYAYLSSLNFPIQLAFQEAAFIQRASL